MLLDGLRDQAEDHPGLGEVFLEGGGHGDGIEHCIDGDAGQCRALVQRDAELFVGLQELGIHLPQIFLEKGVEHALVLEPLAVIDILNALDDVVAAHVEGSFRVARSRMGNFPIYTDVRNGGTKVVTILRKYSGDAHSLARALQAVTGKEVTQYHGRMEVRGRHASAMAEWLGRIGM